MKFATVEQLTGWSCGRSDATLQKYAALSGRTVDSGMVDLSLQCQCEVWGDNSRTGPLQGLITVLKLQSVTHLNTMMKSTMTGPVTSSGHGGTAAAMAQNEQTTEEHSALEHAAATGKARSPSVVRCVDGITTVNQRRR